VKAMVLAAGEGTRLRPLTLALPKPLVPVANEPLLARTLRLLASQNVRDVAVNLFHRPQAILDTLGDGRALGLSRLLYSPEDTLLGTAGGVRRVGPAFLDETFLVLYGDNLYHFDIAPLVAFHREKKALATIATFEAANPSACGLVITDAAGRVTRFQEKPPPADVFTNTANAGVYVLEPAIFDFLPPGADAPLDWGKDVFPALLDQGIVFSRPLDGYLQDTGTPETYRQANRDALEGRAGNAPRGLMKKTLLGENTQIAQDAVFDGWNVVGDNGIVAAGAHLADSILWANCRIGAGARIRGAVLGAGVVVGAGAIIEDGALLANDARVAPKAVVPSGARIAPNADYPPRDS